MNRRCCAGYAERRLIFMMTLYAPYNARIKARLFPRCIGRPKIMRARGRRCVSSSLSLARAYIARLAHATCSTCRVTHVRIARREGKRQGRRARERGPLLYRIPYTAKRSYASRCRIQHARASARIYKSTFAQRTDSRVGKLSRCVRTDGNGGAGRGQGSVRFVMTNGSFCASGGNARFFTTAQSPFAASAAGEKGRGINGARRAVIHRAGCNGDERVAARASEGPFFHFHRRDKYRRVFTEASPRERQSPERAGDITRRSRCCCCFREGRKTGFQTLRRYTLHMRWTPREH